MPDWVGYLVLAALWTGVLCWAVGAVMGTVAAARGTVAAVQRLAVPRDSSVWAVCDAVHCGAHLQTPHDVVSSGVRCRGCGHISGT